MRPGGGAAAITPAAVLLLTMGLAACSGPVERAAQPALPVPTTTGPPTTEPTTTTEVPETGIVAPDPFAIAARALEAPTGELRRTSDDSELVAVLEGRIAEVEPAIQALVWEVLAAGDRHVLAASIYPHAELRGDPAVAGAIADLIAEGGAPLTEIVDGHSVIVVRGDGTSWYLWSNHTHILLTAGAAQPAAERIGQLAAFNSDEYAWRIGDCVAIAPEDGLDLPHSPHGADVVVPCDQPHQYEVVAGDPDFFGDDGVVPRPDEVLTRTLGWCEEGFADHIGADQFDSSLDSVQFFPDPLEWERGDRYAACVTMLTDQLEPRVLHRAVAGRGDELAMNRAPGDCHLWTVREPTVDCLDPHDYEYLGVTESTDARWPASNGPTVSPICEEMLLDRASATTVDGVTLDAFGVAAGPSAWAAGDRRVDCFAVAAQQGFPVRVTGSITGDWEPAGLPGDGFTT